MIVLDDSRAAVPRLRRLLCGKAAPFRLRLVDLRLRLTLDLGGVASIHKIELPERRSLSARKAAKLRTAKTVSISLAFVQPRRDNFCCRRARAGCSADGWRQRIRDVANCEDIRHVGFLFA